MLNNYDIYTYLNSDVFKALTDCSCKETAEQMVKFLQVKNDKYSYNRETNKYFISSFFPSFPGKAWNRFVNGVDRISNNKKRVPIQADLVVTGRCHCQCWHCFRAKYNPVDLSIEKIKECMDSLYKLGTATIGITGGEPMLRPDILDIINLIPEGIEGQLYTTGHNIDEDFAKKIKNSRLTRCIISLDHYSKEIVCSMRHNPNAYKEAINAINALVKYGIYTTVTVCITAELLKMGCLQKYFEFVQSLAVNEVRIIMPIPQGSLEGKAVGRTYAQAITFVKNFKLEHVEDIHYPAITNFSEFESASYFGCGAGSTYISVNCNGMVTPCVAVPLSFGNIFEDSLENIYDSMAEYFPESALMCYGIASGQIISSENIATKVTPLPVDVSQHVAKQCRISRGKADFFTFCDGCKLCQ